VYDQNVLRPRQRLGKYRVERRLAEGGFAVVYKATDTIEGIPVAIKVPHSHLLSQQALAGFRKEVRLNASLDHPNILPIKDANFIENVFVIVYPLGERSLGDRLQKRLSVRTGLIFADQVLKALAHAHQKRVIHCDVKPENFILFAENRLRLADFGIAKLALRTRTLLADGTGTVGFIAPEQALGRPSFRSDVFSAGIILYRMFSGHVPEWPFRWPPPGIQRVKQVLHPDLIDLIKRSIEVDETKRFRDAIQMCAAFARVKARATRFAGRRRREDQTEPHGPTKWKTVRLQEFRRRYGNHLAAKHSCDRCGGPIAENMLICPWCGKAQKTYCGPTTLPQRCQRCGRGMKRDWRFCAYCYGRAQGPNSVREYSDARYETVCDNEKCGRKELLPFMRYCPWCRHKVRQTWVIPASNDQCLRCGWGTLTEFWDYCPWCGLKQGRT
jgi:serine/threonine-protein kinase